MSRYRIPVALLAFVVAGSVYAGSPDVLKPVPEADVVKITAALPKAATVSPVKRRKGLFGRKSKARKVLVFWRCNGFYHGCIPWANKAIELMGEKTGAYEVILSNDMAIFDSKKLAEFDAILLNNTTRLKLDEKQVKALLDFVAKDGKGLIGIHAATDNFYNSAEAAAMMGGLFDGHPWTAGGTWAVKIADPTHPLNQAFDGNGFKVKDEIYQLKTPYSRENLRVLLTLDMDDKKTAERKGKRQDEDYAVSWLREYGKGRVFYCSLGHNNHIFWDKAILKHYLDGIQYALGDLSADATPSAKLSK